MPSLKEAIRIEKLLNRKIKASIGPAQACAGSEREARALCESAIVDILENFGTPQIEVRSGYLIVSQVESSESSWYLIKRLQGLTGTINPSAFLHPSQLKSAIEAHLAQCLADNE